MFIAALFIIAETWKQLNVHQKKIKKILYIHTMEYDSAIKRNEITAFAATWMDLEMIMLSEASQTDTNVICYHLYAESKKSV